MPVGQSRHGSIHRWIGGADRVAVVDATSYRLNDGFAIQLADDDLVCSGAAALTAGRGARWLTCALPALLGMQLDKEQYGHSDRRCRKHEDLFHGVLPGAFISNSMSAGAPSSGCGNSSVRWRSGAPLSFAFVCTTAGASITMSFFDAFRLSAPYMMVVEPSTKKYTCWKRWTCVAGPPLPGIVLSRRNVFVLPIARFVKTCPFKPGLRSFAGGTLIRRMYCAAFSSLRGCAGLTIDIRSRDGAGAITSRWASGSVSAFHTVCGTSAGMTTAVIGSAVKVSVPICTRILPDNTT